MTELDKPTRRHFDALRRKGSAETARGELDQALLTYEKALEWAREYGGQGDEDLTYCNRSGILIQLGQGDAVIGDLRRILMRSRDVLPRYLASYNISLCYDLKNDFAKSRFYARMALDYAEQACSAQHQAHSHNRLGNLLIIDCDFEEAISHFQQGLELSTGEQASEQASFQ